MMPGHRTRQPGRSQRRSGAFSLLALGLLVGTLLLSACGTDAHQAAAVQNKAKLDHELQHAQNDLGIPVSMLKPIQTQEHAVAVGDGGWNYNYQNAEANYALLYNQLTGIEQTSAETLRKQAQTDLQAFTTALDARRSQGFIEATTYQTRLDQSLQQFNAAKLPGDFAKVDTFARGQTEALQALWPAYQKLQDLQSVLHSLGAAGVNITLGSQQYTQDLQTFRDAASATRYSTLTSVIDGQVMQLIADQTESMPYIGASLLSSFQQRIDQLKQDGVDAGAFQQQHDQDQAKLSATTQLADYLQLGQTLNKQINAMSGPLTEGQAKHDFATLQQLVNYAQSKKVLDPANGQYYPAAYEYANPFSGIGDAQQNLQGARSLQDYQNVDSEIGILTTNLRAMLDNMDDSTPHSQAHQTDLQLMQHYGIMQGKVIMISLREQTARFYDNGKLVYWSYITSGDPVTPSPPGLHYIQFKQTNTVFHSPDPPGSPLWYAPTPIKYAMSYADNGYFLHDAWWRATFGPATNLPHWDPAAFNGGSHGCVNFPAGNMPYVFNWSPVGTPVVLY